jgi:lysyl-tRNA synthetase class 1
MRWFALGVDYEMSGKDLTDSVTQSGRIVRALGGRMPEVMIYELFLDANGEKISKSKGNGFTFEEWMRYGTEESLGFYVFREPKSAKQLHAGIVPRAVDEYWQFRAKIPEQPLEQQLGNPAWHLLRANGYKGGDGDALPVTTACCSTSSACSAPARRASRCGLPRQLHPRRRPGAHPSSTRWSTRRSPTTATSSPRRWPARAAAERGGGAARARRAARGLAEDASAEDCRPKSTRSASARSSASKSLRDWFKALYETLLGSSQGPRMGSFIALYGVANTRADRRGARPRARRVRTSAPQRYHLVTMYLRPRAPGCRRGACSGLGTPSRRRCSTSAASRARLDGDVERREAVSPPSSTG